MRPAPLPCVLPCAERQTVVPWRNLAEHPPNPLWVPLIAGSAGWRFNPVSVTFWDDLKVRAWTEDGQRLALYLLTNSKCSGEGFYHLPLGLAADDLSWPLERLRAALDELVATDFVDVDEPARLVLIVKALKYRPDVRGPGATKGALNGLEKATGSPRLFGRFLDGADAYQPDLAAEVRRHYGLPEGAYQPPS